MSLGRLMLVSSSAAIVGFAAYSIYKAGGVRPAMTNAVKGSVKAGNWATKKYTSAKEKVTTMVEEAKSDMAGGVES